jgi:Tfp pilus assembly protein PilF
MAVAAWAGARPARIRAAVVLVLFLSGAGLTLHRAGEWSSGPAVLKSGVERCPSHAGTARLYIHYVLLKDLRFDEARAVSSRVGNPQARAFLRTYVDAKNALHRGDRQRARELGARLLPAAPREDVAVLTDVANLAMETGLHAEAEATYRELLRTAPGRGEIRYNLGLTLAKQGRHVDAAREISSAIAGGYAAAVVWNNLGLAEKNAGEFQRAETAFRAAMDADPRHWHAAYNLARMLLGTGDPEGAATALAKARARAEANGESTAPIEELSRHLGHPGAPGQ